MSDRPLLPRPVLTPEQQREARAFELRWAGDDDERWALARMRGRFAVPCSCGDECCQGWQMAHADDYRPARAETAPPTS